jgi:hypothetical protein
MTPRAARPAALHGTVGRWAAAWLLLHTGWPAAAADGAGQSAFCLFADSARATPCRYRGQVARDGRTRVVWTAGARRVVFEGKRQDGWWSGALDGRPAMGFERNRGHVVLSATDLSTGFSFWFPGMEHGTY